MEVPYSWFMTFKILHLLHRFNLNQLQATIHLLIYAVLGSNGLEKEEKEKEKKRNG